MTKFIGVTDYGDEKLLVNIDNILWFCTYEKEKDNSIIYMATPGMNNYPVSVVVKESKDTILKYIHNACK